MSEFTRFLVNYQQEAEAEKAKTENLKENWIKTVTEFQDRIIDWLEEPISLGLVTFNQPEIEITEERFGIYTTTELVLNFSPSGTAVEIKPIARFIVGGTGRIDVFSNKGRYKVIKKADNNEWYIVEADDTGAEPFKLTKFNEDSLGRILTELIK